MRRNKIVLLILLLMAGFILPFRQTAIPVSAEGSRDMSRIGDDVLLLSIPTRPVVLYVFVLPGETVYFGVSGDITPLRLVLPSGEEKPYQINVGEEGWIASAAENEAGPAEIYGTSGYNALAYPVTTTDVPPEGGILTFKYPAPPSVPGTNPYYRGYWDISVAGSDGEEIPGRMFFYIADFHTNAQQRANFVHHVLTPDGYIYEVNYRSIRPIDYSMFSSNRGLVNRTTDTAAMRSTLAGTPANLRIPNFVDADPDTGVLGKDVANRTFLNFPDEAAVAYFGHPGYSYEEPPIFSNFSYNGVTQADVDGGAAPGTSEPGQGGVFSFHAEGSGTYELTLDFGPNFTPVRLSNPFSSGTTLIPWNGLDGSGVIVPAPEGGICSGGELSGTNNCCFTAELFVKAGEAHFILTDFEDIYDGVTVTMVNPAVNTGTVYYDNTSAWINGFYLDFDTGIENFTGPQDATGGIDSIATPVLKSLNLYSDLKIFDLWTYRKSDEHLTVPFCVSVEPLVSAVKSSPTAGGIVNAGDEIAYEITVSNDGTAEAQNVTVRDYIPVGTTYVSGSAGVMVGANSHGAFVQWNIVSIPIGGTVQVSFTVRVNSGLPSATVIRNVALHDQGNPDPLDPDDPDPEEPTNEVENPVPPEPTDPGEFPDWDFPETGFPAGRHVVLPDQPERLKYFDLGFEIEIPALGVSTKMVEIPLVEGEWNVAWLGADTGVLSGGSLPGAGISYVTGHNHLNNLEIGPFLFLRDLAENDRIFVRTSDGSLMQFRVYANVLYDADAFSEARLKAAERENSLVLITCESESSEGGYLHRRVVFAEAF